MLLSAGEVPRAPPRARRSSRRLAPFLPFIRPKTDRSSGGRERVCGRRRRLFLVGAAGLACVVRGWPGWRPDSPLEARRARRRAVFEVAIFVMYVHVTVARSRWRACMGGWAWYLSKYISYTYNTSASAPQTRRAAASAPPATRTAPSPSPRGQSVRNSIRCDRGACRPAMATPQGLRGRYSPRGLRTARITRRRWRIRRAGSRLDR